MRKDQNKSSIINLTTIFLILVLIVAAYLRLYRISEYMTYLGDEGRDMLVVKHMIVDHKFTLLGPTASVGGFFMGPVYYYFMAPFLWAWQLDPSGPAVMVALFGIATVFLVYRLGSIFSPVAGISASALYAVSPLVIAYSRSSWNPNVVPFFSVLMFYLLYMTAVKPRRILLISIGIVMGIGVQLHYLFLFLIFTAVVWLMYWSIGVRRLPIILFLYLVIGFLIGYSPFLAFEFRHGFPNTRSIMQFLLAGKETGFTASNFFGNIIDVSLRLFGRLLIRIPEEGVLDKMQSWVSTFWKVGNWAVTIFGFGVLIHHSIQRKALIVTREGNTNHQFEVLYHHVLLRLLAFWLILPVFLFGLYRRSIYDYYLGIQFPIPFILYGYVISRIWKPSWGKIVVVTLLGVLIWFNWQGRPFAFPPNNQLGQTKRIAKTVFEMAGGKPFNFALIAGLNSDHAYRYFLEIWGNAPVTIENPAVDPDRKTVTDQLLVICETPDCKPLGNSLWEIAGFGRAEITDTKTVPFVTIYKLKHYSE